MSPTYIDLSPLQVGIAASLMIANGAISVALDLGLQRKLFVASLRTIVQLTLVGLVLRWVFLQSNWLLVISLMTFMTIVAGRAAMQRSTRRYPGMATCSLTAIWTSSWLVTAIALLAVVQVRPWYTPQYAIPLLGMILGNALTGVSLALDRFLDELSTKRSDVETQLALGATRWEAARIPLQRAVYTGLIPTLNSMMVVGIVSLPGMMTGQLLAGASPLASVKYQIVIMFLIAASTTFGAGAVVMLSFRRLFNERHQFLYERISQAS